MIKNPRPLFGGDQETYKRVVKSTDESHHFNVPNISVWIPQELIMRAYSFLWHQPSNQTVLQIERGGHEYPVKNRC